MLSKSKGARKDASGIIAHSDFIILSITSKMPPPINDNVPTYNAGEYISTTGGANRVARNAHVYGASNIMMGGKCIIHTNAIIRGDLTRREKAESETSAEKTKDIRSSSAPVAITCGRYCVFGESCVVRPAYKVYKGLFSFYPVRMGHHVHIGAGSIVESAVIGDHVEIGRNCILGKLSVLKDSIRIVDGAVIPPGTVLTSGTIWAGSPAKCIGDVAESFAEQHEIRSKDYYMRFKEAPRT